LLNSKAKKKKVFLERERDIDFISA